MTWVSCGKSITGDGATVYRVSEQSATHRIDLGHDAWLLVREDGIHVEFAVFLLHTGGASDGTPDHHTRLLYGSGPSANLRECRHIWWGEPGDSGYTFYLNFEIVEAALRELRRWFNSGGA